MRIRRDHLEKLKQIAEKSACQMRIAALGFNKKGECIVTSTNKTRFSRKGGGIHAEKVIMREARQKGIVRILICRIGKGGDLRPIHPCEDCQKIANKLGIIIDTVPAED